MTNLSIEMLLTGILLEDDYSFVDYSKKELVKEYGEDAPALFYMALTEKDENEYMNICDQIKNNENIGAEKGQKVIDAVAAIRKKKVIRFPIRDIMTMYHSNETYMVDKSKDFICRNYERYVYEIIHKNYPTYARKYGEELFQCGVMGLITAMKGYKPELGEFTTYSKFFIIHEIQKQVNFHHNDSTTYYNGVQRQIFDAINKLKADGMEPTVTRISIVSEIKPDIVRRELDYIETTKFRYLDSEDEKEQPSEYDDSPEKIATQNELIKNLFESIEELGKTDGEAIKNVVLMKYKGDKTNEQIAKALNISVGHVKAYYIKALKLLRMNPKLASFYGEYLSDAQQQYSKYRPPKLESAANVKKAMDNIDSFIMMDSMFANATSEEVSICTL